MRNNGVKYVVVEAGREVAVFTEPLMAIRHAIILNNSTKENKRYEIETRENK